MSLLDFLPGQEQATDSKATVSGATCNEANQNKDVSMTPEQQKEKPAAETPESVEYLKSSVIRDGYLWDMRCWERFHDPEEVRIWIRNKCQPNNCGHAVYCIRELMEKHHFSEDQIIELVMQNNHKAFANRLARCLNAGSNCPIFREKGNYSGCNCSERCGGKG